MQILPSYLMEHQRRGVALGLAEKRHLYANDTGTGKTIIGIELVRAIRRKAIVVCPISIIQTAWMADTARFAPDLKAIDMWDLMDKGTKKMKKRAKLIEEINSADICLINFESFGKLFASEAEGGYHIGDDIKFEILIVDESSKVKNPKAKITKSLTKYADTIEWCYLFSGTPAPNSPLEYFPQIRMVNPSIFGTSFYRFRGQFFYPSGYGGYTWAVKLDTYDKFKQRLSLCSSAVLKHDVLDLPPRVSMTREIALSPPERTAYKTMLAHYCVMVNNKEITAANAAVKLSKLRQICSGFLHGEDGKVSKIGTSKVNELLDLLDEIGERQVIIWTQFQKEGDMVRQALEKRGKVVGRVDGTIPQAEKTAYIEGFKRGVIQYIVAHPRSMGHGVTLTNCTDMVYFSMSYSLEEYLQSRDRIYRYGQTNRCSYHFMVAKGTIEHAVIAAVTKKKNVARVVIDYIKKHGGSNAKQRGKPNVSSRRTVSINVRG